MRWLTVSDTRWSARRRLVGAVALLVCCSVAGLGLYRHFKPRPERGAQRGAFHRSPAPAPPVTGPITPPPGLAKTGSEIFGINDPVTVPKPWIEQSLLTPPQEAAALAEDARHAVDLGASMARATTSVYPYLDMQSMEHNNWDWTRADLWVRTVEDAGLEPLMMVGPWPGNQTASFTRDYLPKDMAAYAAYVTRVVERYDGDGVDDMPGLKKGVRYWEVDNEPDLHNSRPPRDQPRGTGAATFETPVEYAQVLVVSGQAIHSASASAKVLSSGFFSLRSAEGRSYVEQLVTQSGVLAAIDIVSVHCYFEQDSLDPVTQTIQAAASLFPGKPVWVTETSVPADANGMDENWQAGMVAAIYGAFLAGGADRIFWHTLSDPPPKAQGKTRHFSTNSLLRVVRSDGGTGPGGTVQDKPAGVVYRRLAALLAHTDPAQYREDPGGDGRLLWTGSGWLAFWGMPTLPAGAGAVTDLLSGTTVSATDTVRAPAYIAAGK